jgi:hypothetical protein
MTLADARERAHEVLLAALRGEDPGRAKQSLKLASTFSALASEYLDKICGAPQPVT